MKCSVYVVWAGWHSFFFKEIPYRCIIFLFLIFIGVWLRCTALAQCQVCKYKNRPKPYCRENNERNGTKFVHVPHTSSRAKKIIYIYIIFEKICIASEYINITYKTYMSNHNNRTHGIIWIIYGQQVHSYKINYNVNERYSYWFSSW